MVEKLNLTLPVFKMGSLKAVMIILLSLSSCLDLSFVLNLTMDIFQKFYSKTSSVPHHANT